MNEQANILLSGRNADLLATRGQVLETAGYHVSTTLKAIEASSDLAAVHLLIVCHTLSAEDRQQDLSTLAAKAPHARALCMTPHSDAIECGISPVDSFQGPRELLRVVTSLLQTT